MTTCFRACLIVTLLAGFTPGCSGGDSQADAAIVVPADASPDARKIPDAALPVAPTHLLITEVSLTNDSREFIEIFNPTPQAVDLTNYYLSDDADYALLPGAFGGAPVPQVNPAFDFIAKFPDGAMIMPGQVVVIAFRYAAFQSVFEQVPDYALRDAPIEQAMVDPTGSFIGTSVSLTNSGESVTLLFWDGITDLVTDVDMVMVGTLGMDTSNLPADKTGQRVDGPDPGDEGTFYQPDAYSLGLMLGGAPNGLSHKRLLLEDHFERHNGDGNGIGGDDETSEDLSRTWDDVSSFSPPSPGEVPPELRR